MRIVIDMQGAQTESRFRGIGRYSLSFARAIVRNRGEHEVILALSGLFPDTIEPIRAAFDGLLSQQNIRVWHAPGPVRELEPSNDWRRETAELIREAFLASLQPDVIHVSSLFEGFVDDAVTSIRRFDQSTPVSVTLHDLIPLLNPDHYLKPNPTHEKYYLCKIEFLKRAAIYLAVSESARGEGILRLGRAQEFFVNTLEAVEPYFQPQTIDEATVISFRQKFGITRPFVLYTGGSDDRKNLPRLIEAYAALPRDLRDTHQLVFAGKMPKGDIERFVHIASAARMKSDELIFTGYITDEELVQFYNLCQLYVFPSWHEGFGLPALEAMACGAPVIGANTSSLPEVIGLDEALFDPFDVSAISQKMTWVLENESFRNGLRCHGLEQSQKFSWDETAKRAFSAWEKLPQIQLGEQNQWRKIRERLASMYSRLVRDLAPVSASQRVLADKELRWLAICIEKNERQLEGYLRPRILPSQITWRIEGPFDSSYSLALLNRETANAMDALGHRVVLHSTEGPGDFPANPEFLHAHLDIARLYARSFEIPTVEADVTSRNLYPPRVADMDCRMNLLHHYAWEESGFPSEWVENFNEYLQGVTCLSQHVEKILVDHGVTLPMSVSGCGVDHWLRVHASKDYRIEGKSFRFLHVSSCFPRKGADVLLKAYGQAFTSHDDVALVIKTFPNPHNEIHRWLAEARAENNNFPDVLIIEDDLADGQLKSLYEQCQVLVAPSRAEGFGLPMAEAMLSSLAVITTGWSGQLDFCNEKTAWLVDYQFAPANTHFGLFDSVWAEPDVAHLAVTMREVYAATPALRNQRIAAGKQLLLEKFKWTDVAERLVTSARSWSQRSMPREVRIGWVTSWNTRCGIATYSAHLVEKIPSRVVIFAAKTTDITQPDGPDVHRCWAAGEEDTLDELAMSVDAQQIDTLVVQFNYGFFNLERFSSFLNSQLDAGRVVVVTMHSTVDPVHVPHKRLEIIRESLARCHRILAHSIGDLNRLKALALVNNVSLFPHGISDFHLQRRPDNQAIAVPKSKGFTIASYGFFLPHKGLLELIEAVGLLNQQGIYFRLRMVNAEYPVPESVALIQQAKEKISTLGLGEQIEMITDFLPDDESLALLSAADLIVYPYQNTGESASGAVRYGLSVGKPVLVSPLAIFDDVASAVFTLPGFSPAEVALGIKKVLDEFTKDSEFSQRKAQYAARWRGAHSYSHLGLRLHGLLKAL